MDLNDAAKAMLDSGVEPIQIVRQEVREFKNEKPIALRTSLRINSIKLGSLNENDYQQAAERSKRGLLLTAKALNFVNLAISEFSQDGQIKWISVKCPITFLTKTDPLKMILQVLTPEKLPSLCLEFSHEILFDMTDQIKSALDELKKAGVKILLNGFGNEYCPIMQLMSYPFDFVSIDSFVTDMLKSQETSASATQIILFINSLGAQVIVPELDREQDIKQFFKAGCFGFTYKGREVGLFDEVSK